MAKISRGIVVTTSEYTKDFLADCLKSLTGTKYPILVVANQYTPTTDYPLVVNEWNGFELGGILRGKEQFDEFIHLMDTTEVKDIDKLESVFDTPGHIFFTKGGYHYMGKFVSQDLPDIPVINNKADAIALELSWLKRGYKEFEPDLPVHTNVFVDKYGQWRMFLENDFIIKYKGTFSL